MTHQPTTPLSLDEFPATSYAEWRAEAEASLKGAPFDKKLITKTLEGIELQPIYNKEDLAQLPAAQLAAQPGQAPYVRGTKAGNQWEMLSGKGHGDKGGGSRLDPFTRLLCGVQTQPLEAAFDAMAQAVKTEARDAVSVGTMKYAGGNAVQELGLGLATGVEYLRQMEVRGLSVEQVAPKMTMAFAMGSDFFTGIAKLRAARMLWARVIAVCGGSAEAQKLRILAFTSKGNQSKLDPYVNMLRDTTEAFAAVAGGADVLGVRPFDFVARKPDDFSKRIAQNTQTILAEECHFDHVADPGGGSYYIETLTAKVAEAAWALFQQVEKAGGMFKALEAGLPQKQVKAVAAKKAELVAQRRLSLIGVNVYANPTEKRLEGTAAGNCACHCGNDGGNKNHASLAHIELLPCERLAEPFERLRAAVSASDKKKVFLANMGPVRQHKARADFSTGFFQAGGYQVLENRGFKTPEEAAQAAQQSGASVVVLCSTDDTYPEIVPALVPLLKQAIAGVTIILAGYPSDHIEAFKAAGIDDFIHMKANCLQTLSALAGKLGIL